MTVCAYFARNPSSVLSKTPVSRFGTQAFGIKLGPGWHHPSSLRARRKGDWVGPGGSPGAGRGRRECKLASPGKSGSSNAPRYKSPAIRLRTVAALGGLGARGRISHSCAIGRCQRSGHQGKGAQLGREGCIGARPRLRPEVGE